MKIFYRPGLLALTLTAATLSAATSSASAQMDNMQMSQPADGKTLPSPPAMAKTILDGKAVTIDYNAPSLRGRVMIGEHDPYDKVWRTGANPATSFVTETDLKIGELEIPAGKYTLYTLPEKPGTPWMLIVNKQTGQWGTVYDQAQDLGRTPMRAKELPASQETMSISFEHVQGKTAELHIKWAKVDEFVVVTATTIGKATAK